MFALFAEHFGAAAFAFDKELGLLQYTTERRLTNEDLQAVSTIKPYHALGTQCISPSGEVITLGAVPFPTFINTGDAVSDDARYDAAKAAWIAADPEGYQRLTDPASNGK